MSEVLYIAAKAPRIGFAKTRLGQAIGHEAAVTLYRAFLQDLAVRFANAPFAVEWFVTPLDAWEDLAPLISQGQQKPNVLIQCDGDWNERQRDLFQRATAKSVERIILIASDSPQITVEVVADAFRQLDRHDLVLGPVFDGGYYLIGMKGWHDVLCGVPMSTRTVLHDLTARACTLGLSVTQVEATFDIDVATDLEHLRRLLKTRDDMPATRASMTKLGLFEGVSL